MPDFEILPAEYKKIIEIEKEKGRSITPIQAQGIAGFLSDYAKFVIDSFETSRDLLNGLSMSQGL